MTPGSIAFSRWITAAALVALASAAMCASDDQFDKDKKECAPQLVGLAPCLAYVGGNAKTPTMDCCTSLKQVLTSSKKCLCLLVKYRNQPDLGVKIDAALALGLPAVCHAPSNTSDCPALLHLAPNSPDSKVFTDFASGHNSTSSATSAHATDTPGSTSSDSKASDGGSSKRRLRALAVFYGVVVVCFFFLLSCPIS